MKSNSFLRRPTITRLGAPNPHGDYTFVPHSITSFVLEEPFTSSLFLQAVYS